MGSRTGGGRTGRSETAPALHTNHNTGQNSSNLLGLLQNTDRFNYFLNYILALGNIIIETYERISFVQSHIEIVNLNVVIFSQLKL